MRLKLSSRHEWVRQSEIRNMSIECDRVGGINLSQGICDLEVPSIVREEARKAIDQGVNTYTRYDGLYELRKAIATKQEVYTGLMVDPEKEIVVSAGSTGAFYCACLALLESGDEVIVFEPYYGYHVSTLIATGATPVFVKLKPPEWIFDQYVLEQAVTPKTKAIVVNTPGNPSGKVFSRDELELIADFAIAHDLFVFTDEIYEHFVYDGREHIAPATLPGMKERTITISGLSKTFSITGWRIGYCICSERWAKAIGHFNDLVYVCAPAPLQMGVAKGLVELGRDYYKSIVRSYQKKRDRMCETLKDIGFQPYVPEGAYYVLCDISRVPGNGSKSRCLYILDKTGVATVPGKAFFHDDGGENLARFCFAVEDQLLDKACEEMKRLG